MPEHSLLSVRRGAAAVVVLEVVEPPTAVRGGVDRLVGIGAWPRLASLRAAGCIHAEFEAFAVCIVGESLHT